MVNISVNSWAFIGCFHIFLAGLDFGRRAGGKNQDKGVKTLEGRIFDIIFSGDLVSFSLVQSLDFSSFFPLCLALLFFISNTLSFILPLLFQMWDVTSIRKDREKERKHWGELKKKYYPKFAIWCFSPFLGHKMIRMWNNYFPGTQEVMITLLSLPIIKGLWNTQVQQFLSHTVHLCSGNIILNFPLLWA